jgi:hypothetical protein
MSEKAGSAEPAHELVPKFTSNDCHYHHIIDKLLYHSILLNDNKNYNGLIWRNVGLIQSL